MAKSITDDTSKACKQYGICANVENYPTELAKKLIAELKTQKTIFTVDKPSKKPKFQLKSRKTISCRLKTKMKSLNEKERSLFHRNTVVFRMRSGVYMEHKRSLCKTINKSWPPRVAHHESGDFKYILNDDIPIQVFSIGICPNSNKLRNDISMLCRSETMLLGYEGQCIEKTRLNEMYYIEGNRTAKGYFHVPTCCSCDLKRI